MDIFIFASFHIIVFLMLALIFCCWRRISAFLLMCCSCYIVCCYLVGFNLGYFLSSVLVTIAVIFGTTCTAEFLILALALIVRCGLQISIFLLLYLSCCTIIVLFIVFCFVSCHLSSLFITKVVENQNPSVLRMYDAQPFAWVGQNIGYVFALIECDNDNACISNQAIFVVFLGETISSFRIRFHNFQLCLPGLS